MKLYLDTCDIKEIMYFHELGVLDGVTTNPTLVSKHHGKFLKVLEEICDIVKTSVSAEVVAEDYETMLEQARKLMKIGPQITIKVPLTYNGLKLCRYLTNEGRKVNVTLCFTPMQALMAAKSGATYISPFIGRLDDIGMDGLNLVAEIRAIYDNFPELNTQILSASVRSLPHITAVAKMGSDVVTLPPIVMHAMLVSPMTEINLRKFHDDWAKAGQNI